MDARPPRLARRMQRLVRPPLLVPAQPVAMMPTMARPARVVMGELNLGMVFLLG